jgi:hypothetical protein
MKSLLVGALITVAASAFAAPPSTQSVEALLALSQAEKVLDVVYAGMEQNIRQGMQMAIGDRKLTAEQQRVMQEAPPKLAKILREELNWEKLKPMLISVYTESFDQEDVDGLIQFYKSPVGQRFIAKQPVVAQKSSAATQQLLVTMMPRLQASMRAALEEAGVK